MWVVASASAGVAVMVILVDVGSGLGGVDGGGRVEGGGQQHHGVGGVGDRQSGECGVVGQGCGAVDGDLVGAGGATGGGDRHRHIGGCRCFVFGWGGEADLVAVGVAVGIDGRDIDRAGAGVGWGGGRWLRFRCRRRHPRCRRAVAGSNASFKAAPLMVSVFRVVSAGWRRVSCAVEGFDSHCHGVAGVPVGALVVPYPPVRS